MVGDPDDRLPGGRDDRTRRAAEETRHLRWLLASSGVEQADDVSDRLIAEFGSMSCVVAASSGGRLRAADPDGRVGAVVSSFRAAMLHVLASRLTERPLLADRPALDAYLRAAMAFEAVECLRALHLDAGARLVSDDLVAEGSVDRLSVRPRQILRRSLEVDAASVILVHNHPGGAAAPSGADVAYTRNVAAAAASLDVRLVDHLVVSTAGVFSFARNGLLA